MLNRVWSIFASVVLMAGAVFGAYLVFSSAQELFYAKTSSGWEKVNIKIETSTVRHTIETRKCAWIPLVTYSYINKNEKYFSSNVSFGSEPCSKEWAEFVSANYKPNSQAIGLMHPEKPSIVVLVPGLKSNTTYVVIAVGLLIFSVFSFLSIGCFRARNKNGL